MPAAERLRWIVFPSDPIIRQSSLTIGVRVRSFDSNRSSQEVERLSGSPGTFRVCHRQFGERPRSTSVQITPNPLLVCSFAENYPRPAHNKNSDSMSNSAHDLIDRTPHPPQVFVAHFKSSVLAHFARILSPQVRKVMQTTRYFRGKINRKSFCRKDFRVIAITRVNFHRFPNLPGFPFHRFPNFPGFIAVSFPTFQGELYRSPRNASI